MCENAASADFARSSFGQVKIPSHQSEKDILPPTMDSSEIEDWELNEVKENDKILKTDIKKCVVCGIGDVVPDDRGQEKHDMLVYSRRGTYKR